MGDLIKIFGIDWHLIIAQVINFGVVFTVLYYMAIRPLMVVLDERKSKIEQGLKDSQTAASSLLLSQQEAERIIIKAKEDALLKAQQVSETQRLKILEFAKETKKNLNEEKVKMLSDIRKEVAELAASAVEKVLNRKFSESENKQWISDSIKDMKVNEKAI